MLSGTLRIGRLRVSWLLALTTLIGLTAPAAEAAQPAARRALLIGINEYIAVPDLAGAVNDVEMIREILVSRFGFEDVEVLSDQAATREGILAAIDRLSQRSRPGDWVYIHYSGHGSQVADASGDEADSLDETLVPHDGRTPGVPDITDDELGDAFARVRGKSVTITLDSCHSGTATREAGAVRARFVPADTRSALYAEEVRTRAVVPLASANHILMAGAADDELALDAPVDGRAYGIFSYALARSLSNAPTDETPRGIFSRVRTELERIKGQLGLGTMPEPQLEASSERLDAPLFAGRSDQGGSPGQPDEARLPWLRVAPADAGRVRLVNGLRLGAVTGSQWAIFPPEERAFLPGAALAEALVAHEDGEDAIAILEPADARIAPGGRAIAISAAPIANVVSVRLHDRDAARAERLRNAIREQLPTVEYVPPERFARFVVELTGDQCLVSGADGRVEIARFPANDEAQLARSLSTLFSRSMTAAELLSLENVASAFALDLQVVGAEAETRAAPSGMALVKASTRAAGLRIRREGETRSRENSLQLRIVSTADCSLVVVDVDTEGGVHLLFPNPLSEAKAFHPGGRIGSGAEVLIPDSLRSGNRAGFHLDYAPPAGNDNIRAFCFESPEVAAVFSEAVRALQGGTGSRGAIRDLLVGRLRPVLTRSGARGVIVVEDAPEPAEPDTSEGEDEADDPPRRPVAADWTAASVTIRIEE